MNNKILIYKDDDLKKTPITLNFKFNVKNVIDYVKIEKKLDEYPSIKVYNFCDSMVKKDIEIRVLWSFEEEEDYNLLDDDLKKECEIVVKNIYTCEFVCSNPIGFKFISEINSLEGKINDLFLRGLSISSLC